MVCPTLRTMVRQATSLATSLPHLGANLYPEIDLETSVLYRRAAGHRLFRSNTRGAHCAGRRRAANQTRRATPRFPSASRTVESRGTFGPRGGGKAAGAWPG